MAARTRGAEGTVETAHRAGPGRAAGMITLADDAFGGRPQLPGDDG
ncbi:hypothetical protein [Mycobacterium helveticum]